jgi:excisionase family DNA binding protein
MAAAFYTTRELQDLLHVDRTTIYRMADAGRLPAMKVGSQWRFPRRPIDQWLGSQTAAGPVSAPAAGPEPTLPVECIQIIQDTFADALGIMIVIADLDGRPLTRSSNAPGLVQTIEAVPEAHRHCLRWWAELSRHPNLQPAFLRSHLGLLCARAFFRFGSELRGMVIFGGVAPEAWPPTDAQIAEIALFLGIDRALIDAHLDEVLHLDADQQRRLLDFVQRLADIITHMLSARAQAGAVPAQPESPALPAIA